MKFSKTVSRYSVSLSLAFSGALGGFCAVAGAVPIAIVDSGTDLERSELKDRAWLNPGDKGGDGQDNDGNGYADDVYGWNFAENNNQVIDYAYLGRFSKDPIKFFEIQLKVLEGTATEEEKNWVKQKRQDENFMKELATFANFVHGTHVAGIAARTAPGARIMAAKLIPTEQKLPGGSSLNPLSFLQPMGPFDDFLMSAALGLLADQQVKMLTTVGQYVGKTQMKVANCSFGTGTEQAKTVVKMLAKTVLSRELSDEEADKYAANFVNQIVQKGAAFANSASSTLFVIAAGNDGSDNETKPVFPANLRLANTITIAATRGTDRLASFSNYGRSKVDLAAPGVGILSLLPGGEKMAMSGTSQASPFVANLAGKIMDINPKLSLADVKKILMDTVDKKDFLSGKVVSEGVANEERAVRAAELSRGTSLADAVRRARLEVRDLPSHQVLGFDASEDDGEPVPMPSLF